MAEDVVHGLCHPAPALDQAHLGLPACRRGPSPRGSGDRPDTESGWRPRPPGRARRPAVRCSATVACPPDAHGPPRGPSRPRPPGRRCEPKNTGSVSPTSKRLVIWPRVARTSPVGTIASAMVQADRSRLAPTRNPCSAAARTVGAVVEPTGAVRHAGGLRASVDRASVTARTYHSRGNDS